MVKFYHDSWGDKKKKIPAAAKSINIHNSFPRYIGIRGLNNMAKKPNK